MFEKFLRRLFVAIIQRPRRVTALGLAVIVLFASQLPNLTKDIRSDAFLSDDNPALLYREKVRETFGLSDPVVIAIAAQQGIYTAPVLNFIAGLSESLRDIENIDAEAIYSIATQNNITGSEDGLDVGLFYEAPLDAGDVDTPARVRDAIRDFPLYQGGLVSNDETAALIVLELLDTEAAPATYQSILSLIEATPTPGELSIYVAGEGAVTGFIGDYIDADALRLYPVAGTVILSLVFLAFLRGAVAVSAAFLILASVVLTVGSMAGAGIPFFVITNALPVILIGISVADCIHIYSEYFDHRRENPGADIEQSIIESMMAMWRPITLTSLTTIAGFLGLAFAAHMPPFHYFGLFTAVGVAVAWLYSLLVLPAVMMLLRTEVAERHQRQADSTVSDRPVALMRKLGKLTWNRPRALVNSAAVVAVIGVAAAAQLQVDGARIDTFHPSTDIYQANELINQRFNGSNNIDIVIEAAEADALLKPTYLRQMEALQYYAQSLPDVTASVSIVDYLKQMNRSMRGGGVEHYVLPDSEQLVAQYLLLYSMSGSPADFEQEIDYDYRLANIRVTLNEGSFQRNREVILALQTYIDEQFSAPGLDASLSGRVYLYYHWIKDLARSHFIGLSIALIAVWLVASLLFRSLYAGLYVVAPVLTSVLMVYSAMVALGIPLGIASSMFAAIAIGLGVDFSIHTVDKFRALYAQTEDLEETFRRFYPLTGRALLFNLLVVALGFGVLVSSNVVPLNNFGALVAIAVVTSFMISMTLLPAMIKVFRPRFIVAPAQPLPAPSILSQEH